MITHFLAVFHHFLTHCSPQIQVYGACVADLKGNVDRGACDREFAKLRACFQRSLRKRK